MQDTFGARVRGVRTELGLTLQTLADASGVSVSMLSQVERGARIPTLPVALRIAEGLGRHLSDLIDDRDARAVGTLRRRDTTEPIAAKSGVRRQLLSHQLPPSIAEVTCYWLPRGTVLGPFAHRDAGIVEQVTVVAGRLNVHLGSEQHTLRAGDSLSFRGSQKHRYRNGGAGECCFVHIASPRR